jgi:hypothetical protein
MGGHGGPPLRGERDDGSIDWGDFLASALKAGVPALEFWRMNPAETVAAIRAASWKYKQELQLVLYGAWHAEAFARTKRLPSLKRLLRSDEDEKPDFEQMKREFEAAVGRSKVAKGNG